MEKPMKDIGLGIQDYRKIKENDYYYVDKTRMIKEFLERKAEVTLVTRPRRFGKTSEIYLCFFRFASD